MITYSRLGKDGRFGNQLWQIAATIGIGTKLNSNFGFPEWSYQKYFKKHLPILPTNDLSSFQEFIEPNFYYNDIQLPIYKNWDLMGYFQSYKYFEHCKDLVKEYFSPSILTNDNVKDVSIHVRRGDYLNLMHIHPVLTMDYYNKAMNLFPLETKFTVFSDDISWCIENFDHDTCFFMQDSGEENDDILQFFYMSKHRHNIIANSSYSWWAAWLNPNPHKKIVAPKIWVNRETKDDRVPPEWIRL